MKHSEWLEKAKKLYGNKVEDWKFKCPACHTVQTIKDFVKAGASKEQAANSIANECIGRYMATNQKAFSDKETVKGKPCDYAGYGLININPVLVEFEDGTKHHAFDFADDRPHDGNTC